jgi:hypothetical protein
LSRRGGGLLRARRNCDLVSEDRAQRDEGRDPSAIFELLPHASILARLPIIQAQGVPARDRQH